MTKRSKNVSVDKEGNFNLTVAALWEKQSGNLMSMQVDDQVFEALKKIQPGGKLFVKFLAEESRTKDTAPNAFLEYISPAKCAEFNAKHPPTKTVDADDAV
jgi:hypothetical protein